MPWKSLANGRVLICEGFISKKLTSSLLCDTRVLHKAGHFQATGLVRPDGSKPFDLKRDRQTMCGAKWEDDVGDLAARMQFADAMRDLRKDAARALNRSLIDDDSKHEITYNWYERGASLDRHIDEFPGRCRRYQGRRRSITWLVYLNRPRGGQLRCYGCGEPVDVRDERPPVASHATNLDRLMCNVAVNMDIIRSYRNYYADVHPRPGTLVMFDSSACAHEVLPVASRRHAVSGWFHEPLR